MFSLCNVYELTFLSFLFLFLLIPWKFISPQTQEDKSKNLNQKSLFKSQTKFYGQPDDLVFALCKPQHRSNWDMNIMEIEETQELNIFKKNLTIKYQSYQGICISEKISYTFYKEERFLYILEETEYDIYGNEKVNRLFELKNQLDQEGKEYYDLTVYGEIIPKIVLHKNEDVYKLDFVKGIIIYMEISSELPSTQMPLNLTLSNRKESGNLDQIIESDEFIKIMNSRSTKSHI